MSNTVPAPDTGGIEPAATTTAAEQQVKDFIESFRALSAKILPKLDLPHPLTVPLSRRHHNLPPDYSKTVVEMVSLSPDLQAIKQYDVDENKADQQQIEAYSAIDQEVSTFLKAIRFFVALKKSKTNTASLQLQAFANAMAKDPAFAHLLPLLTAIKEARRSAKAKSKSQPQSQNNDQSKNGGPVVTR